MNATLKKIPIEKVLFFDIETVRVTEELDPQSKEYELYRKKLRDRDTDEYPEQEQVLEDYRKRAPLKLGYSKIVTIGIGTVRKGQVYIKALQGSEEEILREFFKISSAFDYLCGFNVIVYDLPHCYINASRHFDYTSVIKDAHNVIGKKPWNMDKVVDLFDILKGTAAYTAMSFDEALYHFGLDSSKSDMDGSQVSDIWYNGDRQRVIEYVKQDAFQSVNLFQKMRFEPAFTEFIDKTDSDEPGEDQLSALEMIFNTDYLSDDSKEELTQILKKNNVTNEDKHFIQEILEAVYIKDGIMTADSSAVVEAKKLEITEFVENL